MTVSLGGFFEAMLPFLMGEVKVDRVEALLGPSPSGTTRLGFYQELARRDRIVILQRLYPATRTLAERVRPGLFAELVRIHLARHRSTHWEPNRFGEPFPDIVSESCTDPAVRMLGELADYEWIRFAVGVERGAPIYFRTYDHDVVRYASAVGDGKCGELPPLRTVVIAVHRSLDQRTVTTSLGVADLAVLARRRGLPVGNLALSEVALAAAERRLIRRGALRADLA